MALTTTTATLSKRREGIPLNEMPASYRDLIKVAHLLGVRYVWIDSLYILQDDNADWDRESSKMSGIYRNAYLTIAATRSRNCKEGFLVTRKAVSPSPLVMELRGSRYPIDVRQVLNDNENPLHTRACVFQEMIVSARLIIRPRRNPVVL